MQIINNIIFVIEIMIIVFAGLLLIGFPIVFFMMLFISYVDDLFRMIKEKRNDKHNN